MGGRVRGLDGLRGLAIALVVAAHAEVPGFRSGGAVGVAVFFVLSGYLITGLLAAEQDRTGRLNLSTFWLRRARRLLPALTLVLIFVGVVSSWRDAAWAGSYVTNWLRVGGGSVYLLNHTWSLAIEEQFYLLWPLVFIVLPRRAVGWLLAVAVGWRLGVNAWGPTDWTNFGTDTNAYALLAGCWLALNPRMLRPAFGWAAFAGLLALSMNTGSDRSVLLVAVAGAGLATALIASPVLTWAPLRYLGRISYGVYLWHFPILYGAGLPTWAAVSLSLAAGAASFHAVEEPIRRRGRLDRVGHGVFELRAGHEVRQVGGLVGVSGDDHD